MPKSLPLDRFFTVGFPGLVQSKPELSELAIAYAAAMWAWSLSESKLFLVFAHAVEPVTNKHSKALRAAFFLRRQSDGAS